MSELAVACIARSGALWFGMRRNEQVMQPTRTPRISEFGLAACANALLPIRDGATTPALARANPPTKSLRDRMDAAAFLELFIGIPLSSTRSVLCPSFDHRHAHDRESKMQCVCSSNETRIGRIE